MSTDTKIEWTDATWNPLRGCSKVSEGCRNCYAEKVAVRFSGPGQPYEGTIKEGKWNGNVVVVDKHMEDPIRWQKPRRIFVNSMSDLFHDSVSDETILRIMDVIRRGQLLRGHIFQVLTKRPDRMMRFMSQLQFDRDGPGRMYLEDKGLNKQGDPISFALILKNLWLGVSIENQDTADERIPLLLKTPAAVRFISAEPLLGSVNLRGHLLSHKNPGKCASCGHTHGFDRCPNYGSIAGHHTIGGSVECDRFERKTGHGIDWVIVGGESGPGARPLVPDWARAIQNQCSAAHVPFFFKQWGEWAPLQHPFDYVTNDDRVQVIDKDGIECGHPWPGWGVDQKFPGATVMKRFGKKKAGRELDGRTYDQFPEAQTKGAAS